MGNIVFASRESRLALRQSQLIIDELKRLYPEAAVEIESMKTTGDKILDKSLDKIGGKGLFIKELERALLEERCDFAVHSLKDMPMEVDERLPIMAFSKREDPRDVLILPKGVATFDAGKPIGCSSKRRQVQLEVLYPGVCFKLIRGNVITRLEKLDRGEYGALVLAAAGMKRLGLEGRIHRYFSSAEIVPAAGQGTLAVQGRRGHLEKLMASLNSKESEIVARGERAFVGFFNGGCSMAIGAYGELREQQLHLKGFYYNEELKVIYKEDVIGSWEDPEALGTELGEILKKRNEEWINER